MPHQTFMLLALSLAAALGSCRPSAHKPGPLPHAETEPRPSVAYGGANSAQSAKGFEEPRSARPLDASLQRVVRESEDPVAIVVMDAETRAVLGIARHKGADPGRSALRPGSTLKPLLAWTAARSGQLVPGRVHDCKRRFEDGYTCFETHGELTLPEALATSCNAYAFQLASELGLQAIVDAYRNFGFGKKTGLLEQESAGFVADERWLRDHPTAQVTRPELLVGTGHGPIEVTPLQLAVAYTEFFQQFRANPNVVAPAVREELLSGLRAVVHSELGTGRQARVEGTTIGGKTGAAERGAFGSDVAGQNSWFVGAAPLDEPRFVAVVVVLGGGQGRQSAAPMAGKSLAIALAQPI